jgi:hypothetical protein
MYLIRSIISRNSGDPLIRKNRRVYLLPLKENPLTNRILIQLIRAIEINSLSKA